MNLLDFTKKFTSEQDCKDHLKKLREYDGFRCSKCHGLKHYWLSTKECWKCAACGHRTNLRAGTLMEKTKIPLLTWFTVLHLMTSTKKPFSALEMQRQVGMKRYEPIWYMMQKIRVSMGKRDSRYELKGDIELDNAFYVTTNAPKSRTEESRKKGRNPTEKANVLVMVESTPNPKQTNPHKKKRIMGFIKMVAIDNHKQAGIGYEVRKGISPRSALLTDNHPTYSELYKEVDHHNPETIRPEEAGEKLPWVHTQIANSKREFLGTHHSIGDKYLQNYLNEFTYKLNRRNFTSDLFDRMLIAGAEEVWY